MHETRLHAALPRAARGLLILLLILVSVSIAFNFLSSVYTANDPDRALAINPLNLEARNAVLLRELQSENPQYAGDELNALLERSVWLENKDPRFFGYLGMLRSSQDDEAMAQSLFQYSLSLNSTEFWPLLRRLFYQLQRQNHVRALEILEIITRRYFVYRNRIIQFFPQVLSDPEAYELAVSRLPKFPNTERIVSSLASRPDGAAIAERLVRDWHGTGIENFDMIVQALTRALLRQGQVERAREIFALTLDEEQMQEAGNVFNSRFRLPAGGNPFDWSLKDVKGVSMRRTRLTDGEHALAVRFLDTPVQFASDLQTTFLQPGPYSFKVVYSSIDLVTPKPVWLSIDCGREQLVTIELDPSSEPSTLEKRFDVPDKCRRQSIRIYNEKIVESWRNRYSGTLLLREISVNSG